VLVIFLDIFIACSYLPFMTNRAYFLAKLHKISKTKEWLLKKEMEIPFEIKILLQISDKYYEYIHIQGKTIGRAKKYCKPERFKRKWDDSNVTLEEFFVW